MERNKHHREADRIWEDVPTAPPSHERYQPEQDAWGRAYSASAKGNASDGEDAAASGNFSSAAAKYNNAYWDATHSASWYEQAGDAKQASGMKRLAAEFEAKRRENHRKDTGRG